MIVKLLCLSVFFSLLEAQQYCRWGPNVYPWYPFRCPFFLVNRTDPQRAEYFAIFDNYAAPASQINTKIREWGNKSGVLGAVDNFLGNLTEYNRVLTFIVGTQAPKGELARVRTALTSDTITHLNKNTEIGNFLSSKDPDMVALVKTYNDLGSSGLSTNLTSSGSMLSPNLLKMAALAMQACPYGDNVFPWYPFRCPIFLANQTFVQRAEYMAIANNQIATMGQIKTAIMDYGKIYGRQAEVEMYLGNLTNYYRDLPNRLQLPDSSAFEAVQINLTNDSLTVKARNTAIEGYLNSKDPQMMGIVKAYNESGSRGPIPNLNWSANMDPQGEWRGIGANPDHLWYMTSTVSPYQWWNPTNPANQPGLICPNGQNVSPWYLFRCPPFLANKTEAQRSGYFAIANNKTAPIISMFYEMFAWANKTTTGSETAVINYVTMARDFQQAVGSLIETRVTASQIGNYAKNITSILISWDQTEAQRELALMNYWNSRDPMVMETVQAFNQYGGNAAFDAFARTYWLSMYPEEWNPNQYNPYGNYGQQYGYGQQGYPYNNQYNLQGISGNYGQPNPYGNQGIFVALSPWNSQFNSPFG